MATAEGVNRERPRAGDEALFRGRKKRPDSELPNEKHQGRMTREMRELAKGQPKPAKNSKSRVTGVHFDKRRGNWRADIYVNGKRHFLSEYDSYQEAASVRKLAEIR